MRSATRVLFVFLALLLAGPVLASITPSVTIEEAAIDDCEVDVASDCVAPLAVHFSAVGTTCADPSFECDDDAFSDEAFHALYYKWTFGDSKSETWSVSGQDKNVEYGPLAVHVFDDAGTYTITLTVCSAVECDSTETITIYVDDPDTHYAGNKTYCISTNVNHDDCPPESTEISNESDFDAAVTSALAATAERVLFHAGHTFTHDSRISITFDGPGTIGSYGTANDGRAIVDATGYVCSECNIWHPNAATRSDWRLMDLEINQTATLRVAAFTGSMLANSDGAATFINTLYYRIKRMTGNRALTAARSYGSSYGPVGLFIVENELAGRHNIIYAAPVRGGIIGNIIGSDTERACSHSWRIGSPGAWQEAIAAHNRVWGTAHLDITLRGHSAIGLDPAEVSNYFAMRANEFQNVFDVDANDWCVGVDDICDCCTGAGSGCYPDYPPVGIWPANYTVNEEIQNVIVEDNRFDTFLSGVLVKTATIRNNIFTGSGGPTQPLIDITNNHSASLSSTWVDDIMVYNNSGYRSESGRHFIGITDMGDEPDENLSDTHVFRNNVLWSPNANAEVFYCDPFCASVTESNNIDYDDFPTPASPFATTPPLYDDTTDWYLTGTDASAALGQGYPMGSTVHSDFEHNVRDVSNPDIGAFELQAAGSDSMLSGGALGGGGINSP